MNEIAVVPEVSHDLTMAREPEVVLQEAQRAAACLKNVVAGKENKVMFNGHQYLEFEDWQTIGKFYGLLASTSDPEQIEVAGVLGAKANAQVVDVRTGKVVGKATAWCLRDEPNWKNKPWFQLGSMAQTRAASKALRNLLSWVVVLAGYKPTPAEEIAEHTEIAEAPVNVTAAAPRTLEARDAEIASTGWPHPAETKNVRYVTVRQAGRFWGIAKATGAEDQEIRDFLKKEIGSSDGKMIPADRYDELCQHYQSGS